MLNLQPYLLRPITTLSAIASDPRALMLVRKASRVGTTVMLGSCGRFGCWFAVSGLGTLSRLALLMALRHVSFLKRSRKMVMAISGVLIGRL
jgi:hypothetical protein